MPSVDRRWSTGRLSAKVQQAVSSRKPFGTCQEEICCPAVFSVPFRGKSANIHYIALPGSDWRTLLIDLNQTLLKLYKVCCVVFFFFCCSMLFFLDSLLLVICKSGERFLMRIRFSVGKVFLCSVVFELVSVC